MRWGNRTRYNHQMPIEYRIDNTRRIVLARARGIVTDRDVFGYQQEVWSRASVAGYDEIIDMTEAEQIALPSSVRVMELADVSAAMDPMGVSSRFAIVAPSDLTFGLGRMFQAYRGLHEKSTKQVGVFRSMNEAREWLGIEADCQDPEWLWLVGHGN